MKSAENLRLGYDKYKADELIVVLKKEVCELQSVKFNLECENGTLNTNLEIIKKHLKIFKINKARKDDEEKIRGEYFARENFTRILVSSDEYHSRCYHYDPYGDKVFHANVWVKEPEQPKPKKRWWW